MGHSASSEDTALNLRNTLASKIVAEVWARCAVNIVEGVKQLLQRCIYSTHYMVIIAYSEIVISKEFSYFIILAINVINTARVICRKL